MLHNVGDLRRLDKSSGVLPHRQRLEMRLAAGDLGGLVVAQVIDEQAASGIDNGIEALSDLIVPSPVQAAIDVATGFLEVLFRRQDAAEPSSICAISAETRSAATTSAVSRWT